MGTPLYPSKISYSQASNIHHPTPAYQSLEKIHLGHFHSTLLVYYISKYVLARPYPHGKIE